ncbi:MAG: hypothetical protein ABIP14_10890 [Blastocatellia bacterium]
MPSFSIPEKKDFFRVKESRLDSRVTSRERKFKVLKNGDDRWQALKNQPAATTTEGDQG